MIKQFFPFFDWSRDYSKDTLLQDMIAALIVTIMLVPQSLAYALLAGLPPEMGLYASILPLLAYAIFGTSRALAVGPVAVVSLMTAAAVGNLAVVGTPEYAIAAIALAFLSGVILLVMGLFRLGFLANFLSHPVISGFMTAAIVLISASQIKHLFGISASGSNLISLGGSLFENIGQINLVTLAIGGGAIGILVWSRKGLRPLLEKTGLPGILVGVLSKTGPIVVVFLATLITWFGGLETLGVAVVGQLPSGLPPLAMPSFDLELWGNLFVSALLISIIGFVESVSVGQTLAARRRQRIIPNQELFGLGAANIASAFSGGYSVTGGLSRSVVNFDSGAQTPAAGAYTGIGMALAAILLTPALYYLPKAALAAIIIVAVLSLLDFSVLRRTWAYSKRDFAAMLATILVTLGFGIEIGVTTGVGLSIALYLYKTSKPHVAIVGQVPGTEHFRNILRHEVVVSDTICSIRVDESLYFHNARYLEDRIYDEVVAQPLVKHVILVCPAINAIDSSALESLEAVNQRLKNAGVSLHLSEVKGPVMDRLKGTEFLHELTGKIHLTQYDAVHMLDPKLAEEALKAKRSKTTGQSTP